MLWFYLKVGKAMKNHNKSRKNIYSFFKHFLALNGDACAGDAPAQDDPTGGNCQDIDAGCPNWSVYCSSGEFVVWMAQNCAKTCGKCGGGHNHGNVCTKTDIDANCAYYAQKGYCNYYQDWMATNCAKSCTC